MEKLQNVVLFTAALFSALALFAVGKRYIATSANSRRARKYLLYTSAVLVFLCGTTGLLRSNSGGVAYAQEKARPTTDTNLSQCAGWQRIRSFTMTTIGRLRLREKLDTDKLNKFRSELKERISDAGELKKSGTISEPVRFYVETILKDLAWQVENAASGKTPAKSEVAKRFAFELRLHRDVARYLNGSSRCDDSQRPEKLKDVLGDKAIRKSDITLAAQLKATVQAAFDMAKSLAFKDKLTGSGCAREGYKKLLCTLSDEVYGFVARSRPGIHREIPPDPAPVPEYGVKPLYGVRPEPPRRMPKLQAAQGPTVVSLEGKLKVRRPGGVWRGVGTGTTVTVASVVENCRDKKDVVKFSNGPAATIEPREVLAGWELRAETPPELLRRVAKLIENLAGEDEVRSGAMTELRGMGLSVWPSLQETAFCDVSRRAEAAIQLLRELANRYGTYGGSLTADDLSLSSSTLPAEPVPPPSMTRYGVRPRGR